MTQIGTGSQRSKVQRVRSPQYPTISLRQAIERVKLLIQKVGKAGAKRDRLVFDIGFHTPHGEAISVVATLKKFGLIEPMGDTFAPSERAIDIIDRAPTDARRVQAIKDAALSPQIYRELYAPYRETGLPADSVLQDYLKKKGFNPKVIRLALKNFKETLSFANISTTGQSNMTDTDNGRQLPSTNPPSKDVLSTDRVRRYPMEISIPRNVRAELHIIGGEFRKDDVERLKKQFGRLIEALSEAFQD
jgi:hypothetical protein